MEKLSILLPTFDDQEIVRDCLESVKWADEILVVDSFSTDHTLDICREYGARILQHEYVNSAKQKNWAIPQCAHEWVLQVDTDERLEPGLQEEIQAILSAPSTDVQGYRIPFKHHILGEWVRVAGLYPEHHLRLFRKSSGSFEDKEVHAHVLVRGRVENLEHHILHFGMTTISKQLENVDRYARYQADELKKRGKRFHGYELILRPPAIFFYYYFWKLGFLAGYRGFLVASISATTDFWSHAKLWGIYTLGLPASPK
jgi:glycosyltransferase involved in cell wall biosynthesis